MAQEKIQGIVLDIVRHNDRHNVVTLYTREHGRMAFLSSAGTGRNARIRNARLMPLSAITAEVSLRGNRDLQFLGQVSLITPWSDLYFNPVKTSIVMFVAEFLNAFLRQTEPDAALWDYILASVSMLDRTRRPAANRHIAFLIGLLPFAGIQPALQDYDPACRQWFDMREGRLMPTPPIHDDILDCNEVRAMVLLSRMTAANCSYFRFRQEERRRCLSLLLRYYSVHYPGLGNLKSPEILAETFLVS